jgi:hypothetical protein
MMTGIILVGLVFGGVIVGVSIGFAAGQRHILEIQERKRWTR